MKSLDSSDSMEEHQQPDNETGMWEVMRNGDKSALSFFYTKYFYPLYNYGLKFSADNSLIEDCIQDLFIEIWEKKERYDQIRNVKNYLFVSLRRKIIYKEGRIDLFKIGSPYEFDIDLADRNDPLKDKIDKEIIENVRLLVEKLSPKQKEVIFLIYFEEMSYLEVSEIMNLNVKTVYNLVYMAISELKKSKSRLTYIFFFTISL